MITCDGRPAPEGNTSCGCKARKETLKFAKMLAARFHLEND